MKKAVIYYFSGTGITRLVGEAIRGGLSSRGYDVEFIPMEAILKGERGFPETEPDLAGFGSPVTGFGTPLLVRQFVKKLPRSASGVPSFVFRTAGGASPVNAEASKPLMRCLSRRGYRVFHERLFAIASNWIVPFEPSVIVRLHRATLVKADLMCGELATGSKRLVAVAPFSSFKLELLMRLCAPAFRLVGRTLRPNRDCNGCGLCVRKCPAQNLVLSRQGVRPRWSCNSCMRCVYACPKKALSFRGFGFFAIPDGFDIDRILREGEGNPPTPAKKKPAFFASYVADADR